MNTLIRHVHVFDGKDPKIEEDCNIAVRDNLVAEIFHGESSDEGFDRVIDGGGLYAIPGLTDAHVHLGFPLRDPPTPGATLDYDVIQSAVFAGKLLDHGITTVRDAGGVTQGLKKAIDEGSIPGPRIFPSNAYISQTSGHGDGAYAHLNRGDQYRFPTHAVLADGVAEVQRAVREQLYRGASQIKLMAGGGCFDPIDPIQTVQYSYEELKAAVDAAADYGTYVMTHLYTPESMQRAIKAGVKSLEHGHILDEETAKLIADTGTFLNPMPQFDEADFDAIHASERKDLNSPRGRALLAWKDRQMAVTTELINRYDLKILFGTDGGALYPGFEPRENFDLRHYKKRFGSYKGLLAATGNFNDVVKLTTYLNPYKEGELGVLKKGSYADLLLVNGNPVDDLDVLGDVENIRLVMKNGVIYREKPLARQ